MMNARLKAAAATVPDDAMTYTMSSGDPAFRRAVASMLNATCVETAVDPELLSTHAGCTAILNMLSVYYCRDGGAVYVPVPCYPAFARDLTYLAPRTTIVEVDVCSSGYILTPAMLDAAFDADGAPAPKAVLLTNPNNPTGTVYTKEQLRALVAACRARGVHLICDEIYANSRLQTDAAAAAPFVSVLDALDGDLGDDVHILFGFSKDFAGSGLRCGVLMSGNAAVRSFVADGNVCDTSHYVQALLADMLFDTEFVKAFLDQSSKAMTDAYHTVRGALAPFADAGVKVDVEPSNALFCYVDLRPLLAPAAGVGSPATDADEHALTRALLDAGVLLTPGTACGMPAAGYYRVCFAGVPPAMLKEGMSRVATFAAARLGRVE